MNTIETSVAAIPTDVMADNDAILSHVLSRKPLDPELARRVRERAERITEAIRRQHGILDIATTAIRELRESP